MYLTGKKRSDNHNVDRAAIKPFNTVKEDLNEEEEGKDNDDEVVKARRRDRTFKENNVELLEDDEDENVVSAS